MASPNDPSEENDAPDEAAPPGEKPMGFLDHLEELRWTLIKAISVFIVAFSLVAYFFDDTVGILNWPMDYGLRDTPPEMFTLVTTTPMAIFGVYLTVCFLGALPLSLPFVLYFVAQFVAPALTRKEKGLLIPACVAAMLLFLMGAAFSYFVLVPSLMKVTVISNAAMKIHFMLEADKYYSLLVWMVLLMGAAFQFPMVVQILVYLDLLSVQKLRSLRRIMIIGCFVAAAVITPTGDPFNMTIVALPLYALYEISIVVASVYTVRKKRERQV